MKDISNLDFTVMVHARDSLQNIDVTLRSTIMNFLKYQYKCNDNRNVMVTINQFAQGSIYYTIFNISITGCTGYKAFALVNVVRDLFKGSISNSVQIKNLYMDDNV